MVDVSRAHRKPQFMGGFKRMFLNGQRTIQAQSFRLYPLGNDAGCRKHEESPRWSRLDNGPSA
jgi:hypothetical protein